MNHTLTEVCAAFGLDRTLIPYWRRLGLLNETASGVGAGTSLDVRAAFVVAVAMKLRRMGVPLHQSDFLARHAWNTMPAKPELFVVGGKRFDSAGFMNYGRPVSDVLAGGFVARFIDLGEVMSQLSDLYPNSGAR